MYIQPPYATETGDHLLAYGPSWLSKATLGGVKSLSHNMPQGGAVTLPHFPHFFLCELQVALVIGTESNVFLPGWMHKDFCGQVEVWHVWWRDKKSVDVILMV